MSYYVTTWLTYFSCFVKHSWLLLMLDVSVAGQSDAANDTGWCLRSVTVVLPVPCRPETTTTMSWQHSPHCTATVTDRPPWSSPHSAYDGRGTASDVPCTRGSHHAAVQTRTQLLRQQVYVSALEPRLQPGHGQVGVIQCTLAEVFICLAFGSMHFSVDVLFTALTVTKSWILLKKPLNNILQLWTLANKC